MSLRSFVHNCTWQDLAGKDGLHPLLEVFIDSSSTSLPNESERLIYLDHPTGIFRLVMASLDQDRVAHLLPGPSSSIPTREQREIVWETAIHWAHAVGTLAIHIHGLTEAEDENCLASLGYPVTTTILSLSCRPQSILNEQLPEDTSIRQTTLAAEFEALCHLVEKTFSDSLDVPESIPFRRADNLLRSWDSGLGPHQDILLVAESQHEMVGLAMAAWVHSSDGHLRYLIQYLGVAEGHRRLGWGTLLLTRLLREATNRQVKNVEVLVDQRNEPAISLYRQHGFREDTESRFPIIFHRIDSPRNGTG